MEQTNIALEIKNLSKSIKKRQLLQPLEYQLEGGQILALCGGNGAGKSTMIRLITGLMKPTTGRVTLNKFHRNNNKKEFLRQFGYMPDDFQFQKSMTTKETLGFYAKLKNMSQSRYEEVLQEVGLWEQRNDKVGSFSKGMKQRLLLAQALLAKPSLLILDEPTNGLDPYWVKQFCELMLTAQSQGQTIIFSTHDLHVAEQIADDVIFLMSGEIISQGRVDQYSNRNLYEAFQQLYFNSL